MKELHDAAVEVAARYLKRKRYQVIDRRWEDPEGVGSIDLVAEDAGELVFVDAVASLTTDGFPEAHFGRELREVLAAKWLAVHGDVHGDVSIRFDEIDMMVMDSDRALLRHHVNCFGTMEPAE